MGCEGDGESAVVVVEDQYCIVYCGQALGVEVVEEIFVGGIPSAQAHPPVGRVAGKEEIALGHD
jgi:hypothetical protein